MQRRPECREHECAVQSVIPAERLLPPQAPQDELHTIATVGLKHGRQLWRRRGMRTGATVRSG